MLGLEEVADLAEQRLFGGGLDFLFDDVLLEALARVVVRLHDAEVDDEGEDQEGDEGGQEHADADATGGKAREVGSAAELAEQIHDDCGE